MTALPRKRTLDRAADNLDRTFRLFVSSTFGDFTAERDALQRRVFTNLRTVCASRGFRLQVIDLRWGVSEQAGRAHDTMEICLGEMARARAGGLRPYVLALLGDRYGWRPLPARVPADLFTSIVRCVRPSAARVLRRGYRLDRNVVPPAFTLKPAGRDWPTLERSLRTAFDEAVDRRAVPAGERWRYSASATEQELLLGALTGGIERNSIVAVLRTSRGASGSANDSDARRLRQLRARVRKCAGSNLIQFDGAPSGVARNDLDRLVRTVETTLRKLLLRQMRALRPVSPVQQERASHHAFALERGALLVGRDHVMATLMRGLSARPARPLVLIGPPGSGKSAVLARLSTASPPGAPAPAAIVRFCGLTPSSRSVAALLDSLCREIADRFGFEAMKKKRLAAAIGSRREIREQHTAIEAEFAIPSEPAALALTMRSFCARIPRKQAVVLVIDAIDQLTGAGAASSAWLPLELPDHVRLVVSIAADADPAQLSQVGRVAERVDLPFLTPAAAAEALQTWLAMAGRTLQRDQRTAVLSAAGSSGTPLHLKLLAERAKAWPSWLRVAAVPTSAEQIIGELLEELGNDARHGRTLVHRTLAFIAAGRRGLTEDELADVLGRDEEVMAEFRRRSPDSPEVNTLPPIVLSRLLGDLSAYLTRGRVEGAPVLRFFHRQFTDVIERVLLNGPAARERHLALAHFFSRTPVVVGADGSRAPDRRVLTELPFQLARSSSWPELQTTLTDAAFLAAKVETDGPLSAIDDFDLALPASVPDSVALTNIAEAIRLSTGVLDRRPGEIATQLAGRLLGTRNPVIVRLIADLDGRDAVPRLSPLAASWSSAGGPLLRTIGVDTGPIVDAAVVRDRILAATEHSAVQVWDLASGFELLRCTHPAKEVHAAAFSADGTFAITAGDDGTLRVWDLVTGSERRRIDGAVGRIDRLRLSPDQQRVLSVNFRTVSVWTLTGQPSALPVTLPEYGHRIDDAIETPDGRVVAGAYDGSVIVFERDERGGWAFRAIQAHQRTQVTRLALGADGSVISAGRDGRLLIWDGQLRTPRLTLQAGEQSYVLALVAPDDGREIIVGTTTGRLDVWQLQSGTRELSVAAHKHWVTGAGRSDDGKRLVSMSADGTVRIWDRARLEPAAAAESRERHQDHVTRILITRDGTRAVSASADRSLMVWDLASGRALRRLAGHQAWVQDLAVFDDGLTVVSTSSDGTLRVWDLATGACRHCVDYDKAPLHAVAITPDQMTVLTSFQIEDGQDTIYGVLHWDVATWRRKALQVDDHEGRATRYAASGALVVTGDGRYALAPEPYVSNWSVWQLSDRQTVHRDVAGPARIASAIPCGRSGALVALEDGSIARLSLATGRRAATLVRETGGRGGGLDATADGHLIVTDAAAHGVVVWDGKSGVQLARATADSAVTACAISPDGQYVVAGDESGRVYPMHFSRPVGGPHRTLRNSMKPPCAVGAAPSSLPS
jgi:WD40 repeat protein